MKRNIDWWMVLMHAVWVGFVVAGVGTCAFKVRAARACLKYGYPSASVAWDTTAYCVKRLDQTDVVVPLDEVAK